MLLGKSSRVCVPQGCAVHCSFRVSFPTQIADMALTGLSDNLAVSSCPVRTRLIKMPSSGGPVAYLE